MPRIILVSQALDPMSAILPVLDPLSWQYPPGHTDTEFFDRAEVSKDDKFYGQKTRVSPKDVAKDAVEKCFRESFLPYMVLKITLWHLEAGSLLLKNRPRVFPTNLLASRKST